LTNAIQDWIERVSKMPVDETGEEPDVCIVEVSVAALIILVAAHR
jgi:CTP synthase